ncbi:hypothetical protein ROZALSC1DRAFT_28259 [Rozella allomycis CSF55]|uniref:Uncharacterized protein n=1 Tax=Rozella allomycis (strain CSF55) TaxID=988480 RepID=A0A075AW61_ROZAC|nr:hypothetical protein O9G_001799 [Rozella allomycis CSF55]RKP20242.1 hypothetical protein ROZALSC1DRAFT_28259 [Rozella allomycis CSF55]|eukprot:EPZ34543.1 hypothetical protein O9G_001799 [Rozella allomycis CSF55]
MNEIKVIAKVLEKSACVVVQGPPKQVQQYKFLMENVYSKLEVDSDFALLVDPVYIFFRFPQDGPAPENWMQQVSTVPDAYRGTPVGPNGGAPNLFVMPSNNGAGREEARLFGEFMCNHFLGVRFFVMTTATSGDYY